MPTRHEFEDRLNELAATHTKHPPREWWHDTRTSGGLRLTSEAYQCMIEDLTIEHYAFVMETDLLTPINLLSMSRFMTCPYFLHRKGKTATLTLFGGQEAVMANLYQDVEKFIASLRSYE